MGKHMGFPGDACGLCPALLAKWVSVDAQAFLRGLVRTDIAASTMSTNNTQPPSNLPRKEGSHSNNKGHGGSTRH